jgi:hypothetical protein
MLVIEILMGTAILYLFSMFSILFHELGHLSGYKITIKSNDWIIQIGTGKELFRTKRLRYHAIPIGGAFLFEHELKTKKRTVINICRRTNIYSNIAYSIIYFTKTPTWICFK